MRKYLLIILVGFIFVSTNLFSKKAEMGLIYGYGHAFLFSSSKNMILDNSAGVKQGLHMVFYLKDSSWSESTTIAYSRNHRKSGKVKKPLDIANSTVTDFKKNGSKDYHISHRTNIIISDYQKAEVFHFEGDKWGNYEAVGYIEEENDINYLVYNSKNKNDFKKYYNDFIQILKSYLNAYPLFKFVSKEEFNQKKLESKEILKNKYYEKYESKIMKLIGQKIANQLKDCLNKNDFKTDNFEIIFEISKSGFTSAIYLSGNKNLCECFSWPFMMHEFPQHKENEYFLLHLNIKLKL